MTYRFDDFALDPHKAELRRNGVALSLEPQVFALLLMLVENRDRLVTRDDIIATVWNGRIVSDAAIASRIKTARQILGDDGTQQRLIRTVHSRGFRFVGEVKSEFSAARPAERHAPEAETGKPSIAVLPFQLVGIARPMALIADALPHELIAELSRLHWLLVIARGSSFRFRDANPDLRHIGAVLGVRYCLSGSVEATGKRVIVTVDLNDTRTCGVVWSERYVADADDIHDVRAQIVGSILAALELRIPVNEAMHARLSAPEHLDAWSAYHLGLQHMFRFSKAENAVAAAMFERAVALEPEFARAHAGLSFTHFQNAFLNYASDAGAAATAARAAAERAVELDGFDPFVNFSMGRAYWLRGDVESSLGWLDRATALSPNYAQGIYARAWADTVLCHGSDGQRHADRAMKLSPIDPLHYAMLGTRALSHLVRGEDADAAAWADRAARAPGAHVLIAVIAVACHALGGNKDRAQSWAVDVRRRDPRVTQADFFRSFPFHDAATRQRIANGLARFEI